MVSTLRYSDAMRTLAIVGTALLAACGQSPAGPIPHIVAPAEPEPAIESALPAIVSTTSAPSPPTSLARASRGGRSRPGAPLAGTDPWTRLAGCESTNTNDPNAPFWGYFQFDLGTWRANGGGPGHPDEYSYAEQLAVAKTLQARRGWSPWPVCSRKLGLR